MIELRDEQTGVYVKIALAQMEQTCRLCGEEVKGRWVYTAALSSATWCHLEHLEGLLDARKLIAPTEPEGEPRRRRVGHATFDGKPGNMRASLRAALLQAEEHGMQLVDTVPVTQDLWVAVFGEPV